MSTKVFLTTEVKGGRHRGHGGYYLEGICNGLISSSFSNVHCPKTNTEVIEQRHRNFYRTLMDFKLTLRVPDDEPSVATAA